MNLETFRQRIAAAPDDVEAHASLGGLLAQSGQNAEALAVLEQAHARFPQDAGIQHNLAELLRNTGQAARAEALFVALLDRDPRFLPAYRSLIPMLGARLAAEVHQMPPPVRAALVNRLAILNNNLGNALLDLGALEDAHAAYVEALRLSPAYASALSNLSNSLRHLGRITEAEEAARAALAARPDFAEAWNNLGTSLSEQGRLSEAADAYAQALRHQPALAEARHNAGSGSLFLQLLREDLGVREILAAHRDWGATQAVAPRRNPVFRAKNPGEPIRVGFLSSDFRRHAMIHFVEPLLEHLSRDPELAVVCYFNHPFEDDATRRVRALPVTWRAVGFLDDPAVVRQMADDRLDLLIDLNGHTRGQRLDVLATRPAPVLAHWLGYTFTSGFPAYDFRVTDTWTDPPETAADFHTERVVHLRHSQFCYRPPAEAPAVVSPLPALGGAGIRFGSCNNVQKLNRAVVAAWSRILAAVPDSRLILRSKLLGDRGVAGRVRGLFEAFGTDARRLDLRPHADDNFAIHREIDIALDPFPYSGATTSCDALWMGVPVVTLAGDRSTGRMSLSVLSALGMGDWIAGSVDDYVRIAVAKAGDLDALAAIRAGLRGQFQNSALRDEPAFAADFGRCIREMVAGKG